jgi:predicted DNA-binding WGR domain protein
MITLYRTDDAQNIHRFYHLRIEQTRFGEWALIRQWGRIGIVSRGVV